MGEEIPRRYGVYLVSDGMSSWLRPSLGRFLRRGEIREGRLLRVFREESVRHAEELAAHIDTALSGFRQALTGLRDRVPEESVWRYSHLAIVPFGVELPSLKAAFNEARKRKAVLKPSLSQTLLPAYMLEVGGIGLGSNFRPVMGSKYLVTLHGRLPDGTEVRPRISPGLSRDTLTKLCDMLKKEDYVLPGSSSPIPVLGAVTLKPILEVSKEVKAVATALISSLADELVGIASSIAKSKGVPSLAWDAFFYLTHVLVAVLTLKLIREGLIPGLNPAEGLLELFVLKL